jgi:hypothetical protein
LYHFGDKFSTIFCEIVFQEKKKTFVSIKHFVKQNISTCFFNHKKSKFLKEKKEPSPKILHKNNTIFSKFSGNCFSLFFWGEKKNRGLKKFCVSFFLSFFLKEHENLPFRNLPEHSWGLGRRGIDGFGLSIFLHELWLRNLLGDRGDQTHPLVLSSLTQRHLELNLYIYTC